MSNAYEREMVELYKRSLGEKSEFKGLVCPGTYKKPCRLCELCKEVLFRKLPKEDPLRQLASKLNAKWRYYSNIIFVADPNEIVVLEYGDKIFKQLLAMQMDETANWKDFMNPITGRNLIIERMTGASKEQTDYYVKPKDPSKLVNMEVLNKLISDERYNLTNILESISGGKVKPLYQSKLDKKVEIRVLPSWLGPEFAFKFFEKIDYHYNISEEEFKETLAGNINPVKLGGAQPTEKKLPIPERGKADWAGSIEAVKANNAKSWVVPEVSPSEKAIRERQESVETSSTPLDDDEFPACYGKYDENDAECTVRCKGDSGWSEGCKAYQTEQLAKRRAARRVSR